MSYKLVPTHTFGRELKRLAKKHRSIKADVEELGEQLEENPKLGDEVIETPLSVVLRSELRSSNER